MVSQSAFQTDAFSIAIIVPVFNESKTILQCLETLLEATKLKNWQTEIIVVDDGSTDGTSDLLSSFAVKASHVVFLRHEINRGKGSAIRSALAKISSEFVIIQDADLEYDPNDIDELFQRITRPDADAVFGTRRSPELNKVRWWNVYAMGVSALNMTVRLLYGVRLSDEATCYKLFRLHDLLRMDLQCERFEFCPEVTAKAIRLGVRIAEVPISYSPRRKQDGKKIGLKDAVEAFATLWRFRNWRPTERHNSDRHHVPISKNVKLS